jgi:hypothetical protein
MVSCERLRPVVSSALTSQAVDILTCELRDVLGGAAPDGL